MTSAGPGRANLVSAIALVPPEGAIPRLKSLPVSPPVRSTIIAELIAIADIRATAIFQILACSVKTVTEGTALQVAVVPAWGCVPPARPVSRLTVSTLAICPGRRWGWIAVAILCGSNERCQNQRCRKHSTAHALHQIHAAFFPCRHTSAASPTLSKDTASDERLRGAVVPPSTH